MPELRRDPILGRWVIISSERTNRPSDYPQGRENRSDKGFCPFCSGNEYTTPPEVLSYRPDGSEANSPGWSLRVVPNKYPALRIEGATHMSGDPLFRRMDGIGAHEVIIETPDHNRELSSLSREEIEGVIWAFRSRLTDLARDVRLQYVLLFKNQGQSAGATLEHSHSQLIALPVVPTYIQEQLDGALSYYRTDKRCVFCDIILREMEENVRVVSENDDFIVLCPYASPFAFQTWILPKRHSSLFEDSSDQYPALSALLGETLIRLEKALDSPDYNLVIHTSPLRSAQAPHFHWHLEIIPKLNQLAGFEWGSGFYINPVPPEDAAKLLRRASP